MNRYEYRNENGSRLIAKPLVSSDGRRYVQITVIDCCDASIDIDVNDLEEAIAGIRDMGRQAGGPAPAPRRRLTELEHDAAWHAIEGSNTEAGPDPDTVLNAVLRALAIDPPEDTR